MTVSKFHPHADLFEPELTKDKAQALYDKYVMGSDYKLLPWRELERLMGIVNWVREDMNPASLSIIAELDRRKKMLFDEDKREKLVRDIAVLLRQKTPLNFRVKVAWEPAQGVGNTQIWWFIEVRLFGNHDENVKGVIGQLCLPFRQFYNIQETKVVSK